MNLFELHCVTQYIDVPVCIARAELPAVSPQTHDLFTSAHIISSPLQPRTPGVDFLQLRDRKLLSGVGR